MAIEPPSIAEIEADIINRIENEFSITLPALPQRSFLRSFSTVLAGALWLLYKYGQRIALNLLPSTADGDQLDYIGELFGDDLKRIAALNFIGTAYFSRIIGTTGDVVIPAGTICTNAAGSTFYTQSENTIPDGVLFSTCNIQSSESNSIAAMVINNTLSIQADIENLDDEATIASVTQQASDQETHATYRIRLVERFAQRPQGGAKNDYIQWAKTISGVTRVFVYDIGFSTVLVYFLRDDDDGGDDNGDRIPNATEITAVKNAIDTANRIPVGAFLYVYAPVERLFRLTITSSTILTQSEQDRLRAAAVQYFNGKVMYIDANISEAGCNLISFGSLMAVLVQIAPTITDVTIDEVGGVSGITLLELGQGDVAFLDSTATITYVVI